MRLSSHTKAQAPSHLMSALLIGWGSPTVFQLGSRAIHWACRGGSLGVVEALKSHGADMNDRDMVNVHFYLYRDKCLCVCEDTVLLMCSWSCMCLNVDLKTNNTVTVFVSMSTLQLHSTPLHVATRTGYTNIVEYLLSCGAKINSRDRVGSRSTGSHFSVSSSL